eukprot:TRINITY_DN1955_c0_g2_i2.p1 TRINITY_DN1955_c0_g2~~TRINITY_DN1955_c0_g2_i2.p1  ORF type:complete len:873 (+),score=282.64 TRINITY_DN1955_c0_g2_i2:112-2619(+)
MPIERITEQLIDEIKREYPELETLTLARNEISRIENLNPLEHLQTLDLSQNRIRKIENLSSLVHLKTLILDENRISTLTSCAHEVQGVATLSLASNEVSDLEEVRSLRLCLSLSSLTLHGNPICELPFYRDVVILSLPRLMFLDGDEVTEEDRQKAAMQLNPSPAQRKPSQSFEESKTVEHAANDVYREMYELEKTRNLELKAQLLIVEKSLREQYIAERETNVRLSERLRSKERVCAELCDERDRLRKDVAELRRTSEIAAVERKTRMDDIQSEHAKLVEELKNDLEEERKTVSYLRKYLGSTAPSSPDKVLEQKSSHGWGRLKSRPLRHDGSGKQNGIAHEDMDEWTKSLQDQIHAFRQENGTLKEQVAMLEIKCAAVEEISRIQEDAVQGDGAEESLLTAWRKKTFELLHQLKMQEMHEHDEESGNKARLLTLESDLRRERANVQISQKRLETSQAELSISRGYQKRLQDEVDELRRKLDASKEMVGIIRRDLVPSLKPWMEKHGTWLQNVMQNVQAQAHRLDFAQRRLRTVTRAVDRMQIPKMRPILEEKMVLEEELTRFQGECESLRDERKTLLSTLQRREMELETLRSRSDNLEETKSEMLDMERRIRKMREDHHREIAEKESEWREKEMHMDEEALDARKENTKLSVAVKQMEKELLRVQALLREEQQSKSDFFEKKMAQKDNEIRSLRREKSSLFSTLREMEKEKLSSSFPVSVGRREEPKKRLVDEDRDKDRNDGVTAAAPSPRIRSPVAGKTYSRAFASSPSHMQMISDGRLDPTSARSSKSTEGPAKSPRDSVARIRELAAKLLGEDEDEDEDEDDDDVHESGL